MDNVFFKRLAPAGGDLLVASEDPDTDASSCEVLDALWNALLQLVLYGGAAQQLQPLLDLLRHRCQLLLASMQRRLGCIVLHLPPASIGSPFIMCPIELPSSKAHHARRTREILRVSLTICTVVDFSSFKLTGNEPYSCTPFACSDQNIICRFASGSNERA
jgi:hypothetical protein